MFQEQSSKSSYFGAKRSTFNVTSHKKTLSAWVFALLWVLASSIVFIPVRRVSELQQCEFEHRVFALGVNKTASHGRCITDYVLLSK